MIDYLNQNYYGDQSYGVAAAALDYFGVSDLHKLTIAQAAILAAIPQSPTAFDLRKNAVLQKSATDPAVCPTDADQAKACVLVVPADSKIAQRRDFVLSQMTSNRHLTKAGDDLAMPGAAITDEQITAAFNDPIIIQKDTGIAWRAPHFVWQVRHQLGVLLCGQANADDCPVDRHRRVPGHDDARLEDAAGRREVGEGRGDRPERQGRDDGHAQLPQGEQHPEPVLDPQPRRARRVQRRPRRLRLPDRPGLWPTSAAPATTPPRAARSSSPSSTSSPTAGASRVRRSRRSTTSPASTTTRRPRPACTWTS